MTGTPGSLDRYSGWLVQAFPTPALRKEREGRATDLSRRCRQGVGKCPVGNRLQGFLYMIRRIVAAFLRCSILFVSRMRSKYAFQPAR
jgi:hypothetical protein